MAKSIKSVYFESALLIEAEAQKVDINSLCNEALRMAVNSVSSPAGEELKKQAETAKDNQTMVRYSTNRNTKSGRETWAKAVALYGQKYNLSEGEVLRKFN
jgi:hypothetical protein